MQQLTTGEDDGRIDGRCKHRRDRGDKGDKGGTVGLASRNLGRSVAATTTSSTSSSSSPGSSYQCFEGTFQDFIQARKEAASTAVATDDDDLGSFDPLTSPFDILVREWVCEKEREREREEERLMVNHVFFLTDP
jgi:hypothetical protein